MLVASLGLSSGRGLGEQARVEIKRAGGDCVPAVGPLDGATRRRPKALAPGGSMEEEGCNIVREEP